MGECRQVNRSRQRGGVPVFFYREAKQCEDTGLDRDYGLRRRRQSGDPHRPGCWNLKLHIRS